MSEAEKMLVALGFGQHKPTAVNVRQNSRTTQRAVSAYTTIVSKPKNSGLEIHVADDAPFEIIDIPVLITQSGLQEIVQNDIYIGAGANVIILAGCGICADGCEDTMHRGVHNFWVGERAKLKYIERHYATGTNKKKIISPTSLIQLARGAEMIIETNQLGGVDRSQRITEINLEKRAKLVVAERVFTDAKQRASSLFRANLKQDGASLKISSRAVATNDSRQEFVSKIIGEARCFVHVECDAIIKSRASVNALPQIYAKHREAHLIHEASIGKIAGDQLSKLMSLGLSKKEAEAVIINGFLK